MKIGLSVVGVIAFVIMLLLIFYNLHNTTVIVFSLGTFLFYEVIIFSPIFIKSISRTFADNNSKTPNKQQDEPPPN